MKTDLVVAGFIFSKGRVLLVHHKKLGLWLPVGGHINRNETPDEALLREIKEEVGLDAEILNVNRFPVRGTVKKNLAVPFHVNVHSAGDHEHCCLFYLCTASNADKLSINGELKNYGWFSERGLIKSTAPEDVRLMASMAFGLFRKNHRSSSE